MSKIYLRKIKKELTECRIIQVDKQLKKTRGKYTLKYKSPWQIKLKYNTRITNLYFKITTSCNLKCYFCSQSCDKTKNHFISLEDAKNVLLKAKQVGVLNLYYTGGEPLVHKDIAEIVKFGHELGFNQSLITNGSLLQNSIDILKYINKLGISLHGREDVHDKICGVKNTFKNILNTFDAIKKNKIQVDINYTLCDDNINFDDIYEIAKLCKENKFNFYIARLNYIGNARFAKQLDLNKVCEFVHKLNLEGYDIKFSNCMNHCEIDSKYSYLCHGCGAGLSMCAIDHQLNVYECASSDKVIGNLKKQSFNQVFKTANKNLQKHFNNLPTLCKICKNLIACRGGCKVEKENGHSTDYYLNKKFETFKVDILEKKLGLNINKISLRENEIILPFPMRIIPRKYYSVLKDLNGNLSGNEIVKNYKNKNEIIELLFVLNSDGYIVEI